MFTKYADEKDNLMGFENFLTATLDKDSLINDKVLENLFGLLKES